MMTGSNNGIIENKSFIVHIYQQEIYIKNDYNLAAVKIYQYYMKKYVYDIKHVNTVNFIIDDLLRSVTKTVLVFGIK